MSISNILNQKTGQNTVVLSYTFCQQPDEDSESGCKKYGFNMDFYKLDSQASNNCKEMLEPIDISSQDWLKEIKSVRLQTREKSVEFGIPRASSTKMQIPLKNVIIFY